MLSSVTQINPKILHVSRGELLLKLRDDILRLQGFEVTSTLFFKEALEAVSQEKYDLVLIDVDGDNGVREAEQLCSRIMDLVPGQHVAYVCNYRVAIHSDCPTAVIRAEFNPEGLVRSIREVLEHYS